MWQTDLWHLQAWSRTWTILVCLLARREQAALGLCRQDAASWDRAVGGGAGRGAADVGASRRVTPHILGNVRHGKRRCGQPVSQGYPHRCMFPQLYVQLTHDRLYWRAYSARTENSSSNP